MRAASANTKASAAIVADRIIIGLSSDHVISALAIRLVPSPWRFHHPSPAMIIRAAKEQIMEPTIKSGLEESVY